MRQTGMARFKERDLVIGKNQFVNLARQAGLKRAWLETETRVLKEFCE